MDAGNPDEPFRLLFPIHIRSLRFREPVQRSVRILGKRTFGQNLQVLFVVFPGFGFIAQFFLAHGKTEAGNGVAILVVKSFLVAIERGFVVFALEVIIADLNVLQRLQRVPGMEFLYAGGVRVITGVGEAEARDGIFAGRMVLGIILGRADIDSRIVTGAFPSGSRL